MNCTEKDKLLQQYHLYLSESEHAASTGQNYLREARCFLDFLEQRHAQGFSLTRQDVLSYKNDLIRKGYSPATINARLAATNTFLRSMGHGEFAVGLLRRQRRVYSDPDRLLTKTEYFRLIDAASRANDPRVLPILISLCSSGIRVSELPFLTAEALGPGCTTIRNKGKYRTILLPSALCALLKGYCAEQRIATGPVFLSRHGKPLHRTQIWRILKKLADDARIAPEKVYPHALRHLFARTFYAQEKDLVALADILGHSNINTTRMYVLNTAHEHRAKLDSMGLADFVL